jgi:hypothetical protein
MMMMRRRCCTTGFENDLKPFILLPLIKHVDWWEKYTEKQGDCRQSEAYVMHFFYSVD